MELIDILDEKGLKKGYTKDRAHGLTEDEYALVIHLWIKSDDGRYLVQQRSKHKNVDPYMWSTTCGFAMSNEDSFVTILRELEEELGVKVGIDKIKYLTRLSPINNNKHIADIFYLEANLNVDNLVLQEEEVADAMYLSVDEIRNWILEGKFNNFNNMYDNYFDIIFKGE